MRTISTIMSLSLIDRKTQEYIDKIDSPENGYDALIREVGRFDIALLATGEDLDRPRVEIVDFEYPDWETENSYIAPKLQELQKNEWTYRFEGDKRQLDGVDTDTEYEGDIYLGEDFDESCLNEFSKVFFDDPSLWEYMDEIDAVK